MVSVREAVLGCSVAASALIVSLAGIEVAFRLLNVAPDTLRSPTEGVVEYDSLLGWRKIPHYEGMEVTPQTAVTLTFNSRGLRSPEYPYEKPSGVRRVLALGDSFAEGYTVENEHLFSHLLERKLNDSGLAMEVVNGGTRGYSTDQELLFYLSEGRRYQPDLTIVLFHDNDVWYNAQPSYPRGPKPLYRVDGEDVVLTNVPPPRMMRPEQETEVGSLQAIKGWFADSFHLYRFVRDRVKGTPFLYDLAVAAGAAAEPDAGVDRTLPGVWGVFLSDPGAEVEAAWEITEALLVRLRDEVEADGGRLLVFYVPAAVVTDEKAWRRMTGQYRLSGKATREAVRHRLAAMAERHQMELLDPTREFRRRGMGYYVEGEGHWNEAGHELAASLMAGWIQDSRRPRPALQAAPDHDD